MGRITDNRADVYQEITDQMVAMLEAGTRPWSKSWNGSTTPNIPLRSTGVPYRGINVLTLWVVAMTKGYTSPHWLTFKQALALGGCVRKGEKGSTVVYANKIEVDDKGERAGTGEDGKRQVAFLKRYTVFNAEQINGIEAKYPAPLPIVTATNPDERDVELDALFFRVPITVQHKGSQPYYQPSTDHVVMPEFADFHTGDSYYSTLAHELCHATGHVDRLARPTLISTKREDYAREELVAELGAAFVSGAIGIKLHDREDHAAYLASWLSALRNDKRCIFTAATQAQAAADWLLSRMGAETAQLLDDVA
ncbi:ArdC family protein [Sphingomonas aerolata]|uniref:ArdC family protein n=1 Tax=Sphingomonas aerolata TaxID=185951 RepID=UPI00141AE652|nr:zincin-like metallopeptidase domain-containing protein [Sphingomonas aerolata]NII60055.1 antirestriction protein ArdC [Sphingomonas aerolata]